MDASEADVAIAGSRTGPGKASRPDPQAEREGSQDSQDSITSSKVAHTLTACCRCRQRKSRCDPGLPRCGPCERTGALCEYYDTTKGKRIPRTYVIHLQDRVRALEIELARLEDEENQREGPDPETLVRGADVRLTETDESRFLGPSSGIAITRFVMELAKRNTETKSIREVVPDGKAKQVRERFAEEDLPTSKAYPLTSAVAAPTLPSRGLTDRLVTNFNSTAQYIWPTLHEPSFRRDVQAVYDDVADAYQHFVVRMVLAISMQRLDTQYAGLADSYYLAALLHLEAAVRLMNLKTLQCFALIAQYSLLTPTRTAAYFIVGLAMRLCQKLGLSEEATISVSTGSPADALETDMRRRLFWIITSMEFGLAHTLGRPSSLAIRYDHMDVKFFSELDDECVTPGGMVPGKPCWKKMIAIHFFRMRLLQAEIREKLYQRKRPEPTDDGHPWFREMQNKLENWRSANPTQDEGSGFGNDFFTGRYNTMIVFMFRPSPQIPNPSPQAAIRCYDACAYNIPMHKKQIEHRVADISWVFTQTIFMALSTMLWTISYEEVRALHPSNEVLAHCETAIEVIFLCSKRWPGAASALGLYENLVDACLKVYQSSSGVSPSMDYGSAKPSPASTQDMSDSSPRASPSSTTTASTFPTTATSYGALSPAQTSPFGYLLPIPQHSPVLKEIPEDRVPPSHPPSISAPPPNPQIHGHMPGQYPYYGNGFGPPGNPFNPASPFNALPVTDANIPWNPAFATISANGANHNNLAPGANLYADPSLLLGPMIHPQYLGTPWGGQFYTQRHDSLSQEQQTELMHHLETDQVPDFTNFVERAAQLYRAKSAH
ncbi:hypothetical protein L228DRAFT_12393 [Xylona heveae TC161]|uniref:Zn(2)-C6 fungal-type domain-containing protein n=1 Tax=Xylona heveae (strain CBS 132557 / TC161) TaxID=1328760 RepID=A0A165JMS4_XYLHT|nr:hypothetical protein L228DRAFT_12393 [Xylona heveae TC161]KZF26431.1 hypothetical protein L228DRAFT_12393 [Xylona heveae TC161]